MRLILKGDSNPDVVAANDPRWRMKEIDVAHVAAFRMKGALDAKGPAVALVNDSRHSFPPGEEELERRRPTTGARLDRPSGEVLG